MPFHHHVGWRLFIFVLLLDVNMLMADSKGYHSERSYTIRVHSTSDKSVSRLLRATSGGDLKGAEERMGLSVSTVEKIKSKLTSSKVSPEQLQKWIKKEKSIDEVFIRLHLHQASPWLFEKPQFATWVKYVDDLSAKDPTKGISVMSTLTSQYSDDVLYKMIEQAKKIPRSKDIATKLEAEQMKLWLSTRKDPYKVFHLFNVGKSRNEIFNSPEFAAWVKYVDDFNSKYPEEPMWMTPTLMKYSSHEDLFKMTERAKWSKRTMAIATKVEADWLQAGLQSRKTPLNVLKDLGIGKTTDTLLDNPLIKIWMGYLDAFNARYPDKKTTMIETLTQELGDATVATMLHVEKSKDATKSIAMQLESAQQKLWLNNGKSIDDVFRLLWPKSINVQSTDNVLYLLKVDKRTHHYRDNPLLSTWVSYMNFFITENPNKKAELFSALEREFKDEFLHKILNAVKKFPSMEITATKIQTEKIRGYLQNKEPPEKVFVLLGLDDVGNHVLGTPEFKSWLNYVELFNKQNPQHQVSWFSVLRKNYNWAIIDRIIDNAQQNPSTVEIGTMAKRAWLQQWLDWEKSPSLAFKFLNLEKTRDETLGSPAFQTWVKYLNDFNQRYPDQKTSIIDGIRANYHDATVLRMLETAKGKPSTEKLAIKLESALIDKWLAEKKTPADLSRTVLDVGTSNGMIQRYTKKLDALSEHAS